MKSFFSIIIPVFNDPDGLEDTLAALLNQNYPDGFYEIIVVDNGSTDQTLSRATAIKELNPRKITVLQENEKRGSYAARNKGIKAASGDLVCFIDSDVTMDANYLVDIYDFYKVTGADYFGCRVQIHSPYTNLSVKYQMAKAFNVQWYLENRNFAPTCCLTVSKSVLETVGTFDSRLESGGDWEFGRRVHAAGFPQAYADNIVVKHPARRHYRDLWKKKTRCARGEAQLQHYFPGEFGDINFKLLSPRNYVPANPWRLKRELEKKKVPTNVSESILLSFFHIPLNTGCLLAYNLEKAKLAVTT